MSDLLSGYDRKIVFEHYLDHLSSFTPSRLREKIGQLDAALAVSERSGSTEFISLGENCGAAVKIREHRSRKLGASFFDNIVIRLEDAADLLRSEFAGLLNLKYLHIAKWDGIDSVYDEKQRIYYHHDFIIRIPALQKGWTGQEPLIRVVDETDIPLFYAGVRVKFEYLAEKFLRVARSNTRKVYFLRRIEGDPISAVESYRIAKALADIGARNASLAIVHSKGVPDQSVSRYHRVIEEGHGIPRWGSDADWHAFMNELILPSASAREPLKRLRAA
jgi:Putative papain-like cysteine peptidase (DUF1796)